MHELEVTTFTAAICGLILIWLGWRVGRVRMSQKILIGDGGNEALLTRMRAQANFVEYVPVILILMGLVERVVGYSVALGIASAVLILSRLAHAVGMERPAPNPYRAGGAIGTGLCLAGLSLWSLVLALRII